MKEGLDVSRAEIRTRAALEVLRTSVDRLINELGSDSTFVEPDCDLHHAAVAAQHELTLSINVLLYAVAHARLKEKDERIQSWKDDALDRHGF